MTTYSLGLDEEKFPFPARLDGSEGVRVSDDLHLFAHADAFYEFPMPFVEVGPDEERPEDATDIPTAAHFAREAACRIAEFVAGLRVLSLGCVDENDVLWMPIGSENYEQIEIEVDVSKGLEAVLENANAALEMPEDGGLDAAKHTLLAIRKLIAGVSASCDQLEAKIVAATIGEKA